MGLADITELNTEDVAKTVGLCYISLRVFISFFPYLGFTSNYLKPIVFVRVLLACSSWCTCAVSVLNPWVLLFIMLDPALCFFCLSQTGSPIQHCGRKK